MTHLKRVFTDIIVATERSQAMSEMAALAGRVDGAIIGVRERVTASVLRSVPNLQVIGSIGTGTDHIDLDALAVRNVKLVTAAGVNARAVAEHAVLMALGLLKSVLVSHEASIDGTDRAGVIPWPRDLGGRRVGVIGCGPTGVEFARLATAFGCAVYIWTRHPGRHPEIAELGLNPTSIRDVFSSCEVVSIHLPLTDDTRGMVTSELVRTLPNRAVLVNVARKEIFALPSLLAALKEREDVTVAIDDFGLRQDQIASELGRRCLLSPHMAGVTEEALKAMQDRVVSGLVEQFDQTGMRGQACE
jgi:lactate dehydrogenase-like 2-hydroxyacid dehydrogenase